MIEEILKVVSVGSILTLAIMAYREIRAIVYKEVSRAHQSMIYRLDRR